MRVVRICGCRWDINLIDGSEGGQTYGQSLVICDSRGEVGLLKGCNGGDIFHELDEGHMGSTYA